MGINEYYITSNVAIYTVYLVLVRAMETDVTLVCTCGSDPDIQEIRADF